MKWPFSKKRTVWDRFWVLGVFVSLALAGSIYGVILALRVSDSVGPISTAAYSGPTLEAYRIEARDIIRPFFDQARQMTPADLSVVGGPIGQLAAKTQERFLRLRVPADAKDFHLATVLLLDRWQGVTGLKATEQAELLGRTQSLIEGNAWIW